MEQKLVLHEAIHEPKNGDIILELTDVQLHTNARPTQSVSNTIQRSIENKTADRIFYPILKKDEVSEKDTSVLTIQIFNEDDLMPLVQKYQSEGKRVFIKKPTAPLPTSLGSDSIEFLNSKKGKRVIRWMSKIS